MRDPGLRDKWEFRKRAGRAHKAQYGPGESAHAKKALSKPSTYTLECKTCSGLVSWVSAKKQAKARPAWGQKMCRTDGCGRPGTCSKAARKRTANGPRYEERQQKMADELVSGKRVLVAWPKHADDKDIWERPEEEKRRVVKRVRKALGN